VQGIPSLDHSRAPHDARHAPQSRSALDSNPPGTTSPVPLCFFLGFQGACGSKKWFRQQSRNLEKSECPKLLFRNRFLTSGEFLTTRIPFQMTRQRHPRSSSAGPQGGISVSFDTLIGRSGQAAYPPCTRQGCGNRQRGRFSLVIEWPVLAMLGPWPAGASAKLRL
jgi:hypothetical protein